MDEHSRAAALLSGVSISTASERPSGRSMNISGTSPIAAQHPHASLGSPPEDAAAAVVHQAVGGAATANGRSEAMVAARFERLYAAGLDRKLALRQWAARERVKALQRDAALEECTFRPAITARARALSRPRSLSPERRAFGEVLRRRERLARRRAELAMAELDDCTFRPLTLNRARLAAAAFVRQPHLHSRLHDEAAARAEFRDGVQPEAVEVLEERLGRRPRAGGPGGHKLTTEEIENVIARLMAASAPTDVPSDSDSTNRGARPRVSIDTERLFERRKQRLGLSDDVVARLSAAEPPLDVEGGSDSEDCGGSSAVPPGRGRERDRERQRRRASPSSDGAAASLQRPDPAMQQYERRRAAHLQQLYMRLAAEVVSRAHPPEHDERPPLQPADFTDDAAENVPLPALLLGRAAASLLDPPDASDIIGVLLRTGLEALVRRDFVAACLRDVRRTGPKRFLSPSFAGPRGAHGAMADEAELRPRPTLSARSHELTAHHRARSGDIATRLLRSGGAARERREAARESHRAQTEADIAATHSFRPVVNPVSAELAAFRAARRAADAAAAAAAAASGVPPGENAAGASGTDRREALPRPSAHSHSHSQQHSRRVRAEQQRDEAHAPATARHGPVTASSGASLGYYPAGRAAAARSRNSDLLPGGPASLAHAGALREGGTTNMRQQLVPGLVMVSDRM